MASKSCADYDSTGQTETHLERQEYHSQTKLGLLRTLVLSIFLCGCEF